MQRQRARAHLCDARKLLHVSGLVVVCHLHRAAVAREDAARVACVGHDELAPTHHGADRGAPRRGPGIVVLALRSMRRQACAYEAAPQTTWGANTRAPPPAPHARPPPPHTHTLGGVLNSTTSSTTLSSSSTTTASVPSAVVPLASLAPCAPSLAPAASARGPAAPARTGGAHAGGAC